MGRFAKIKRLQSVTILNVWQGSEYTSTSKYILKTSMTFDCKMVWEKLDLGFYVKLGLWTKKLKANPR